MWNALTSGLVSLAAAIIQLFPASPFEVLADLPAGDEVKILISFLNWFVPFSAFVSITEVWLSGVAIYYIYQIVLRWIKVIE